MVCWGKNHIRPWSVVFNYYSVLEIAFVLYLWIRNSFCMLTLIKGVVFKSSTLDSSQAKAKLPRAHQPIIDDLVLASGIDDWLLTHSCFYCPILLYSCTRCSGGRRSTSQKTIISYCHCSIHVTVTNSLFSWHMDYVSMDLCYLCQIFSPLTADRNLHQTWQHMCTHPIMVTVCSHQLNILIFVLN